MSYIVAVPTFNRYQTLIDKTLGMLHQNKIKKNKIYLFVANKEEEKKYKEIVPKNLYHKIVVGVIGLHHQRNFISKYFKEGTNLVQFDDDISEVKMLIPGKEKKNNKVVPIKNLHSFFINAFKELKKNKLFLWGVYPVDNAYFMQDKTTHDLRFVVGPMWGMINRHDKELFLDFCEKEDVLRTLLHYHKDGGVVRYNNITIATSYYREKGGMQSENKNRKKEALKSAKVLVKRFPNYCKLYLKKKSGHPEVRLRDITKNKKYQKTTKKKNNSIKRKTKKKKVINT